MKKVSSFLFFSLSFLLSCQAEDEVIDNPIVEPVRHEKLVTIGDSQTANCGWQPWVVTSNEWIEWSQEETINGLSGYQPMAVGGTLMKPSDEQSIYLRGRDAIYYHPSVIIIYAGQNDQLNGWIKAGNKGATPLEVVTEEPTYNGATIDQSVSTLSAFKGLIEYLSFELPDTKIILMTHVPILCVVGMNPSENYAEIYPSPRFATQQEVIDFELNERYPKDEMIRALGVYYDLPVIDLWQDSGITFENVADYYDTPSNDCTQVHLNAEGEKKIAICISNFLNSVL